MIDDIEGLFSVKQIINGMDTVHCHSLNCFFA